MKSLNNKPVGEKIVKAAIKINEKIWSGYRHSNIMADIWAENHNQEIETSQQGFLTDTGRFVDRTEAADIAFKAGQIGSGINSLDSYMLF